MPRWNAERGSAQVIERVRLKALTIVEGRAVNLDRVDKRLARELFVLHALVRGEWETHHAFVARNERTDRRGARHGGPGPPARHPRRRGRHLRLLRRSASPTTSPTCVGSTSGGGTSSSAIPTCSTSPSTTWSPRAPARSTSRRSRRPGSRRAAERRSRSASTTSSTPAGRPTASRSRSRLRC